jgi:hypothetical protein
VIVRPTSASSGGSKVFIVTIPGASADSISVPRSAVSRRRAVISTSGSSGTYLTLTTSVIATGCSAQKTRYLPFCLKR